MVGNSHRRGRYWPVARPGKFRRPGRHAARGAQRIQAAVANDFAVATQAVLIGMAIVLAVSILIALAHPGGRALHEKIELDDTSVPSPDPA